MISDYFADFPNLAIVSSAFLTREHARFASCCYKFSARENESRTIVEDHTDFFAIDPAGMPIKVNCSKAVLSFISDPGFPAFLFLVLIG